MAGRFEPKTPVHLDPPKSEPISLETLSKCNGIDSEKCYVAIKGKVFDVTGNKAYLPGGSYHIFAGHDASRALARTSTKADDVKPEWSDLPEKEQNTLNDWLVFFSKRYNIVGLVDGAINLDPKSAE